MTRDTLDNITNSSRQAIEEIKRMMIALDEQGPMYLRYHTVTLCMRELFDNMYRVKNYLNVTYPDYTKQEQCIREENE